MGPPGIAVRTAIPGAATTASPACLSGVLERLVQARQSERPAVLWAFAYFFTLLCGYSLLKPVRDTLGVSGSMKQVPALMTATFVVSLLAVPAFSALVAQIPRHRVLPLVYRSFALQLAAFFLLLRVDTYHLWVARAFFVWTSVYNLFVVSVFWSFMADLFESDQGKRLFGFIAAGGTAGGLVGPAVAALLAPRIGPFALLLIAAALLELSVQCIRALVRWAGENDRLRPHAPGEEAAHDAPVGGSMFEGIGVVFRSRFLGGLAAQTILFSLSSTFLYLLQLRMVASAASSASGRTALFAQLDLLVNGVTLVLQLLLTGPVLSAFGLAVGLAIVPAITAVGFAALFAVPALPLLAAVQAVRRGCHYAFERPSREVLFTEVPREEKYKAKNFIDTVVYRGGDAVGGWLETLLGSSGLSAGAITLCGIPLAASGYAVANFLARRHRRLAHERSALAAAPLAATTEEPR